MEKGDTWGMVGGIASVVLDEIFMGLDFKEVKVDKVTNTIKNEGRNQLYDLSLEAILNGGISDSEMRELISWSYDFDFSAEIFNLFN